MNLAALRVTIRRRNSGEARYPAFNSLQVVQESGMDWSRYVDVVGRGWLYDKTSGHDDDDVHSPRGRQLGLLLVPVAFADQAVAAFADQCERVTEVQCEQFYDNRVAIEEEDETEDDRELTNLDRRLRLLREIQTEVLNFAEKEAALKQRIVRALDPSSMKRGVRDNPRATWAKFKAASKITFEEPS